MIVDMHNKATDYAMAHPAGDGRDGGAEARPEARSRSKLAVPNVELTWKIDDLFMQRAKAYAQLMLENKQIRQMLDLRQVRQQAVPVVIVEADVSEQVTALPRAATEPAGSAGRGAEAAPSRWRS